MGLTSEDNHAIAIKILKVLEDIRDYEAKLQMKQNHSYVVDSSLSLLKDLINPQDHQSREQAGAHLPESLYPSETNGQITFGNHALDLSQLQPAPESESVLDWGRLFTL
ncbi:hypothetical protein BY996DRAFT_6470281 [Phakopsora pachyrhizi]|nr:hypothetical protein BY996DRAFT_6470281 [Phakopsora pachyrhizi]